MNDLIYFSNNAGSAKFWLPWTVYRSVRPHAEYLCPAIPPVPDTLPFPVLLLYVRYHLPDRSRIYNADRCILKFPFSGTHAAGNSYKTHLFCLVPVFSRVQIDLQRNRQICSRFHVLCKNLPNSCFFFQCCLDQKFIMHL